MEARKKITRWKHGISTLQTTLDLKRRYAETFYDRWVIISAEHGLVPPHKKLEPYETHIDDRDLNEFVSQLKHANFCSLRSVFISLQDADEVSVLAGKDYCEAITKAAREDDEFTGGDIAQTLNFPFEEADLGGIGEQMGWMKTALEEHLRKPGENYKGQVGLDRYTETLG